MNWEFPTFDRNVKVNLTFGKPIIFDRSSLTTVIMGYRQNAMTQFSRHSVFLVIHPKVLFEIKHMFVSFKI
jgi:hypothetical protein